MPCARWTLACGAVLLRMAAAAAAVPLTAGCGMYGCDPAQSWNAALPLPLVAPKAVWQYVTPGTCGNTSASAALGCVATSQLAVCAVPVNCDATTSSGLVALTADGQVSYTYTGSGSGRCVDNSPFASARPQQPLNLPLIATNGDLLTYDPTGLAYVRAQPPGSTLWIAPLDPTVPCPQAALTQMSLADAPAMVMSVGGLGEVASFLPQGLPDATIVLHARDNGTTVFPPPPPPLTDPLASSSSTAGAVGPTNASGVLVPIAPSIVVGNRAVFLTRFYAASAPADASVWRPTASLYLAAIDQRGGAVNRMWWAWQLRLPTDGTFGDGCVPVPSNASLPSPDQTLSVGGPVAMADGATVTIVLRCGSATWGYGVQLPPAGSTATPAVLWQVAVPVSTAASAPVAPVFVTRFPGSEGAVVVWDAGGDGAVVTVDAASGDVLSTTHMTDIVASGVAAGRCDDLTNATAVTPVAPPLGSPPVGEQAHAAYAVLARVTTTAPPPSADSVWLLGLQQVAANASATLQWCTSVPLGDVSQPPQLGQMALVDNNGTRILVSLPGGVVVALG